MNKALEVINVEKVYGTKKGAITKAVAGVSFSVEQGEFVAIMGPSGSGKTTLLNCIATIDKATSGEIVVGNTLLSSMKKKDIARFRSTELGFIFQHSNLLDTLTCKENIALSLTINKVHPDEIERRIASYTNLLNIGGILNKYPYEISGGQAQRVAVARALVSNPTLVVADEPTGALDSKNSTILLKCFEELNQQKRATILMVTHDVNAASWCKRVLFLRDGKFYSELVRGSQSRLEFFERIQNVVFSLGGADDALY